MTQQSPSARYLQLACWLLSLAAGLLAVVAWGQGLHWRLGQFTPYQLFPLFGLLAFSLMWSQYLAGVLRRLTGFALPTLNTYLMVTGYAVLLFICLHPGLLIYQLWRDGYGWPPASYLDNYVTPALHGAVVLGTASFCVLIALQLRRWFQGKRWWKLLEYAVDLTMLAIFYHGLQLGSQLQAGWFRGVWLFYGLSLVAALSYIYYTRVRAYLAMQNSKLKEGEL